MDTIKCEECGTTNWVKTVVDPYWHDVYGKTILIDICEDCFIELEEEVG